MQNISLSQNKIESKMPNALHDIRVHNFLNYTL